MEVDAAKLASIVEHAKASLSQDEYRTLRAALDTLVYLTDSIEHEKASLKKLRELLFGSSSEKTKAILEKAKQALEQARAGSVESPSAGADGNLHVGDRLHVRRAAHRALFHGPQARRGEPGGRALRAEDGRAADPDV